MKELDLMRKVKGLQLIYAKRRQHRELLLQYLPTENLPVVYWLPAKHNEATQGIMDTIKAQHESWMVTNCFFQTNKENGCRRLMNKRSLKRKS